MGKPEEDGDALMSNVTGTRAIWWLYKHDMWGYLEDFGLMREDVEPAFVKFDHENVVKNRLAVRQARKLARLIPELKEASVELRLAYALKIYDESNKQVGQKRPIKRKKPAKRKDKTHMTKRYYHAEVSTLAEAEEIATEHADFIVQAGGTLDVGRSLGSDSAVLIVSLPDSTNFDEVLPNRVTWQQMAFHAAPAVEDQGVPDDEEEDLPPVYGS